ncbi:MAG: hypothetical protein FWD02_02060 [Bacteroidales bacterium]|nr:hypothetical protein [Bacteroidales bacterium]
MSKSLLQTRIVDKLEVIATQVDSMNKFGKNIPLLHLDVLKSNIRTLYEQICELERGQMHSISAQKTVHSLFSSEETIASKHEEKHDVVPEIPVNIVEIKEEVVVETITETIVETPVSTVIEEAPLLHVEAVLEEIIFEEQMEEQPEVQNSIPDIFSSLQTIVDRYKTPDSTLNEAMAISNSSTINTAVKQVRDLKSAIGINEKFLFINDLFKGNMKEYTDTIVMLSDAETLDSVHEVLAPVKGKYGWSEDSIAYVTLIDFLQRKFV